MNSDELKKILDDHAQWLRSEGGTRADLAGANLTCANLAGADLAGATLPEGWSYASVSFSGHGERGRRIHALRRSPGAHIEFSCGCFSGDEGKLRKYISNGEERFRKTRTLALDTIITLIDATNE